jgi:hypothetical protein
MKTSHEKEFFPPDPHFGTESQSHFSMDYQNLILINCYGCFVQLFSNAG